MEEIEAKFRIVTPMFMSGADQTKAELRVPSIKGALRFWWRALALGGKVKDVKKEESKIFGSTDTGRSNILLSLSNLYIEKNEIRSFNIQWKKYVGYGILDSLENKESKEYIKNGSSFSLNILAKDDVNKPLLLKSIKTLGLLGGLGGRSRKGWGSLTLLELNGSDVEWSAPRTIEDYKEEIKDILSDYSAVSDIPQYTAFSKHTKIHSGNLEKSSEKAQKILGENYKNAINDCDKSNRKFFGLPRKDKDPRRASPLFLHIQYLDEGDYLPVASFFNARFTPDTQVIFTEPIYNLLNSVGGEI